MSDPARINLTLSIPRELALRLKHMAVDHSTSVSQLVRELVERALEQDDLYQQARRRQTELMRHGLSLGLDRWAPPSRDSLHER